MTGRRAALAAVAGAVAGVLSLAGSAAAMPLPIGGAGRIVAPTPAIQLEVKASGLDHPTFVVSPNDDSDRLFILEQTGRIRIYQDGAILATPFLNLSGTLGTEYEQGLLGLAFHPDFRTNHKLYVAYTDLPADLVIREYRTSATNPDQVNKATARTILRIPKPFVTHNGGMLNFGSDGYLYISVGDGGGAGDVGNHAQRT